ncbi:MAG TPA: histidine--tRNA ligase [Candidatus Nanoarchaeia archaeon]|nr:histidine--tRNA ligase [Candidatus Nanoarchaeia archaeon]
MANLNPVRGMRDFLPEDAILRQEMLAKIAKVFRKYGFSPMETPAMEYLENLTKKFGEEEKLIFALKFGSEQLGLKYDQTVPSARVIGANQQALQKPFKRYMIDRSWRGERPQKGRLREFLQCDVDTFGSKSLMADAEIIACINEALSAIGIKDVKFKINSRKLVSNFLECCGVSPIKQQVAVRSMDKMDKIGPEAAAEEMRKKGIGDAAIGTIFELLKSKGDLDAIGQKITLNEDVKKEMKELMSYLKKFKIDFEFDLSLVRGLDYYTGTIFEAVAPGFKGSVAGGGRYDNLVKTFANVEMPVVGGAIGFDAIYDQLQVNDKKKTVTEVFVIPIGIEMDKALEITQQLRAAGINSDMDLIGRGISKNLDYASKLGIPYVIFVGAEELKQKKLKLKDMKAGKEELLDVKQIISKFVVN